MLLDDTARCAGTRDSRGVTLGLDRLRSLLHFDVETGRFTRLVFRGRQHPGAEPGAITAQGYRRIAVDGTFYMAHRLAWFYVHGRWPAELLDHINGNRSDNRICNLREATASQNAQNQVRAKRSNRSGFLGVRTVGNDFQAWIKVRGHDNYLGCFKDPAKAHAVYLDAKRRLHEFNTL